MDGSSCEGSVLVVEMLVLYMDMWICFCLFVVIRYNFG